MDFTIVTPSFRQLDYLGCCIASAADQQGVNVEHIVQDGGTTGFAEFANQIERKWPNRPGYRRTMISEKDEGMYDAINRGLRKGSGAICAYLNCDEQYLPGALVEVGKLFLEKPDVDVILGDVLVVGPKGRAICHRKMVKPGLAHTWTCHFAALSAGIFIRRELVEEGILFDTRYRAAADAEWFVRVLRRGKKVRCLRRTTSTFMEDGANLGLSPVAKEERARLDASAPAVLRILRPAWVWGHRFRRLLRGAYRAEDVNYQIYVAGDDQREHFSASKLRTTWPGRMWSR
jgi:glycosyltransferase involved in cell wall biosynthesis